MNIVTTINEWQSLRQTLTKKVGFIPTMGYLHQGHFSLCERAQQENDITVVSIFVNPTQFNQSQDFLNYPQNIERDIALLQEKHIDYLFLPTAKAMYEDQYSICVTETELSQELEGEYRPGHFTGMLTVVLKFLNLIQADKAYFGEKDFQQYLLIKKMAQAFFLPTTIIPCKTIRMEDGLALSSRNVRLNENQRKLASFFPKLLHSQLPLNEIKNQLEQLGFKVDYLVEKWQRRLAAVWIDDIRLIDNIELRNNLV